MVQALARVPPSVSTVNTLSDSCPLPAGSTVLGFLRALCQVVHITYRVDGDGFFQGALSGGSCPLSTGSTVLGFLRALCQGVHVPYLLGRRCWVFSGRSVRRFMSPICWVDGAGFSQGALSGGSCPLSTGSNGAGFSQGALSRCTKKGLQSGSANAAIFFSGRTFSNLMSRVGRTLIIHRI